MKLLELQSTADLLRQPLLLATDSSISLGGRPVFLPEISRRWTMQVSPAFRISRLGKTISERFAGRYYDAMTLAARLIPVDLIESLGNGLSPWATAFDGAISLGEWIQKESSAELQTVKTALGPTESEVSLPADLTACADKAIATLSRSFILKNGDVIVTGGPVFEAEVAIDTHVEFSSNSRKILSFNIK